MRYHRRPFMLREIKIELTHRCNLSCLHCSSDASSSNSRQMGKGDCLRILCEAIGMGVKHIAFSGGEPLLWEGLEEAVETASNGGMNISVYTSGNVRNISRKVKELSKRGVKRYVFSIFGKSASSHEAVTRIPGSFRRTIEAIGITTEAGVANELHFVPLSSNYRELEDIAALGRALGISCVSVLRFVPQGRGQLLKKRALNKLQNLSLKRTIERLREEGLRIRTGSPYNFLMLNEQPKCSSGIDRLIIGPDLRIYPCDAFKNVMAEEVVGTLVNSSLQGTSLSTCWKDSPFLEAVREYLTTPFSAECSCCKALDKCLSGCLAQKVLVHYDFRKQRDPDCLLARSWS
jgi:radical SAM protein with 4Fe4S-binding SPASM domain